MNENLTVYERIALGHYKPQMAYPQKPKKPLVLSKKASDLTSEEIASLPTTISQYEMANLEYEDARKNYYRQINEAEDRFRIDLEKEYGLVDHPKAGKLFSIAWDMGHSAGLSEVESYYSRLAELLV